jgi:ribosome-associated heat shock protein Hsp15
MRIDKYLWCIRVFKSRTQSTELCNAGKVGVNNVIVKPAREVKPGDILTLRRGPVTLSYAVLALPKTRVGAALVPMYANDITHPQELEKLRKIQEVRAQNTLRLPGRPTKRDRRDLEDFLDGQDTGDEL